MKTTMKKTVAYLLAIMLVLQIVPVFADQSYESNTVDQGDTVIQEVLKIINENGTAVLKGQTIQLLLPYGYDSVLWESEDTAIADVDQDGLVTANKVGVTKITVTDNNTNKQSSTTIEVLAPETEAYAEEIVADSEIVSMTILVNGSKVKTQYDGQPHEITYTYSSDSSEFDPSLVRLNRQAPSQTDAGATKGDMTASDFYYDDENVNATFIVKDGVIYISPVEAKVKANDLTVSADEYNSLDEGNLTATITGLIGEDDLQYELFVGAPVEGGYQIVAQGAPQQGGYNVTYETGTLTVIQMKEYVLYNIAQIGKNYYRLARTTILSAKDPDKDPNGILDPADYQTEDYDFTDVVINLDGNSYVYNCAENAEEIIKGAHYYEVKDVGVSIVKNKIGGKAGYLDGEIFNDPKNMNSIHRDFLITLVINKDHAQPQTVYNMLSVNGSNDYYKLNTTIITANPLEEYAKPGKINEGEYVLEPYNFQNTIITIDGEEYRYSPTELTGEYSNYYTVSFYNVEKCIRFNGNAKWFNNRESWLDSAYEEYGNLPNETVSYHANYKATLHKGIKPERSVTIESDWAGGLGYVGMKITLTAHPEGFEEGKYTLQWEYSTDGSNWIPQDGANGETFTYELNETTTHYTWRVVASDL